MARLPENIERVQDGKGYRYRGYDKDGFCARLHHNGRAWEARSVSTGRYLGSRRTLALMGVLLSTVSPEG